MLHLQESVYNNYFEIVLFFNLIALQATVFPTSSFCEAYPKNYSFNKELLRLLGPEAYFKLARFVQATADKSKEAAMPRSPGLPYQLVLSLVNSSRDGNNNASALRPVSAYPLPPSGAGKGPAWASLMPPTASSPILIAPRPPTPTSSSPSSSFLTIRPFSSMQRQDQQQNPPPERPFSPSASLLRPSSAPPPRQPPPGLLLPSDESDLPVGATVQLLSPGTPILVGAQIRKRTTAQTSLPRGVYMVTTAEGSVYYVCIQDLDAAKNSAAVAPVSIVPPSVLSAASAPSVPMVRVLNKAAGGGYNLAVVPANRVSDKKFVEEQNKLQKQLRQ